MLSNKVSSSKSELSQRLNKNQRCKRILSVAKEILIHKGSLNLNIDEIISIAGGSKGSIYECFGDKTGLIAATFEELGATFCQEIELSLKPYYKGTKPDTQKFKKELPFYDQKILTPYWVAFLRNLILSSIESNTLAEVNYKVYKDIINCLSPAFSQSKAEGEKRASLYLEVLCTNAFLNWFFYQEKEIKNKKEEIHNTRFLMNYISQYIFIETGK